MSEAPAAAKESLCDWINVVGTARKKMLDKEGKGFSRRGRMMDSFPFLPLFLIPHAQWTAAAAAAGQKVTTQERKPRHARIKYESPAKKTL